MILNTGNRTDIPAYYSEWFYNRVKEKYVLVRNPYFPTQVIKYNLAPDVVDVLCFCTKNPQPMLKRLDEISHFKQFWFVTITAYERDIEPNVPNFNRVIESFKTLSNKVGANAVGWRYDPIFISSKYSLEYHVKHFEQMAKELCGYTNQCVISFIDLYEKTKRNFLGIREVSSEDQEYLVIKFVEIATKYNMTIYTCSENTELRKFGVNVQGCMTKAVLEKARGSILDVPKSKKTSRSSCSCLLGNDIGVYNTCNHACLYCYANYDRRTVMQNMKLHDPKSPLLIGNITSDDKVNPAKQISYSNGQIRLF